MGLLALPQPKSCCGAVRVSLELEARLSRVGCRRWHATGQCLSPPLLLLPWLVAVGPAPHPQQPALGPTPQTCWPPNLNEQRSVPLPPPPPQFPYPILNNLPFPLGYASFVLLGFVVVLSVFQLGKAVKTLLGGSSSSSGGAKHGAKNGGTRRRRASGGSDKAKDQ